MDHPSPNGRQPAYVAIARKAFETDPFWLESRSFSRWEAWVDLIQEASWRARRWALPGGVLDLRRGETRPLSRSHLAQRWGWSESRVSRFVTLLLERRQIEAGNETPHGTTYLLVNYDFYQPQRTGDETAGEAASERPVNGPRTDTEESKQVRRGRMKGDTVEAGASTALVKPVDRAAILQHLTDVFAEVDAGTQRRLSLDQLRDLQAEVVFTYWQSKLDHKTARLDPKRRNRIKARLKENDGDVSELLYVVNGALRDPNLMGQNERNRKYDGIETIFRDRGQVERLSELGGYTPGKVHPRAAKIMGIDRGGS